CAPALPRDNTKHYAPVAITYSKTNVKSGFVSLRSVENMDSVKRTWPLANAAATILPGFCGISRSSRVKPTTEE
ncbi:hypothetical protein, partial [Paraburkholderia graminis]|uniref:hypothetical protein n=1 Tax=Paraburkholderia graminis TaxID=60548 RepID=UPI00286BFA42